jgi:hypothetical protein
VFSTCWWHIIYVALPNSVGQFSSCALQFCNRRHHGVNALCSISNVQKLLHLLDGILHVRGIFKDGFGGYPNHSLSLCQYWRITFKVTCADSIGLLWVFVAIQCRQLGRISSLFWPVLWYCFVIFIHGAMLCPFSPYLSWWLSRYSGFAHPALKTKYLALCHCW